jgi:hypothetical protein
MYIYNTIKRIVLGTVRGTPIIPIYCSIELQRAVDILRVIIVSVYQFPLLENLTANADVVRITSGKSPRDARYRKDAKDYETMLRDLRQLCETGEFSGT